MTIFWRKLKYNDSHKNIIRIQLKKEVETFHDRTECYYLKYAWYNWRWHKIYDKNEDFFGKISDTVIAIQIQLEYNWKGSGDVFV